jgi:2-polyprenyl-3-methyl-5-hydroxy-6-metoxy-1,4-benzoquinol methylase
MPPHVGNVPAGEDGAMDADRSAQEKAGKYRRTAEAVWLPGKDGLSPGQALRRIDTLLATDTWDNLMLSVLKSGGDVKGLKVAEVGCGTGTLALSLGLLGAEVTLIDFSREVLQEAAHIYGYFGVGAALVKADCLEAPGAGLAGTFDIVMSGGLAEHFEGAYRERCLAYHRDLLKPGGMVMVGVPNRLSPFYQWIRLFRTVTGTWDLDVEIPFSAMELRRLAAKTGLKDPLVFGTATLLKDLRVYSMGFVSAVADLLPEKLVNWARGVKAERESRLPQAETPRAYAVRRCGERLEELRRRGGAGPRPGGLARFSSGLQLIGFK